MNPADSSMLFTPIQPVEAQLVIKHSRFIAWLISIANRAAAEESLEARYKKFPDATHHCFAWRIGFDNELQAFSSDAGEPSGTAGKPILQALESRRLTNVVCVVTRYFGGTKLGTGGLMRAYSAAAFAHSIRQNWSKLFRWRCFICNTTTHFPAPWKKFCIKSTPAFFRKILLKMFFPRLKFIATLLRRLASCSKMRAAGAFALSLIRLREKRASINCVLTQDLIPTTKSNPKTA